MDPVVGISPVRAELQDVRVDYAGSTALRALNLEVLAGSITVIAGPNGAGKTTLLEVIAGTRKLTLGSRHATESIALVPQITAISDRLPVTVGDVVAIGAWGRAGPRKRMGADGRSAVASSLDRLGITELAPRRFATLSGGQRQRTLLAQGLARQGELLLLDEPTTGLDVESADRIRDVIRSEAERGTAVVCVSHDPLVLESADQVVRLSAGTRLPDRTA